MNSALQSQMKQWGRERERERKREVYERVRGEKREKERWSDGGERETNRDSMIEQIKNGKIFFRA